MRVFLSAPISTSRSEDYEVHNSSIIALKEEIQELKFVDNVFYVGVGMRNKDDFDSPTSAFKEDIGELLNSDIFLLVYPDMLPTSAIFEAGVAYHANKKLYFYCNDRIRLPYLFYGINSAYIKEYNLFSEIFDDFKEKYLK